MLSAPERAIWTPFPGPQTEAYLCRADELFYGGAAGGGKTDLALGLAGTAHYKSIVYRREFPQFREIIERSHELFGSIGRYNQVDAIWRLMGGRTIEFGSVQYPESTKKYQGRPHDLAVFDELPNFKELMYLTLSGWVRTTHKGQRVRIVNTGNPPTDAEGEWVIKRWAPWLDPQHSNPARPGELRWYAVIDGKDTAVESGESFEHKGERIFPKSRTFIPAFVTDNPYYMATGYMATLQAMPEPLRSQLLKGDFRVGRKDDDWQVIPTEWIQLAMARWTEDGRPRNEQGEELPLTALGVDVARGGDDQTVLQPRYYSWFDRPRAYPGSSTPRGSYVAGLVGQALSEGGGKGYANIDVIGVGASAYDSCVEANLNAVPVNFARAVLNTDRAGVLHFVNTRAWAYWSVREALDPEKGDGLAIPPDPELLADLTAARWLMRTNGVQVEDKEQIKERIGRSPDKGDAFVLACLPDMSPRIS